MFYCRVIGLYRGRGGPGDDEDFDLGPPAAHGAVEPVRFGQRGLDHQFSQGGFRGCGVLQGAGAQQGAELFLDLPGGVEFAGRVVGVEDTGQAVLRTVG